MYPHPIGFKVDFQPKVINAQYIVKFFAKPATGLALIRFYYLLWSEILQPYTTPPSLSASFEFPDDRVFPFRRVLFCHSKYQQMKRMLIIAALVCFTAVGISSCVAQKGCKSTQGYVGYGGK